MSEDIAPSTGFTPAEAAEIADHFIHFAQRFGRAKNTKVAATYALNTVRILRDRLETKREILESLYTDEIMVPKPLVRFVRAYLDGKYSHDRAALILDDLQSDIRQHYFRMKIPHDDPANIPRSTLVDFAGLPGWEKTTESITRQLKGELEKIITEYAPQPGRTANELYELACKNMTGLIDFDVLVQSLAELVAQKDYSQLTASIGLRDPTPRELAVRYADAFETVYNRFNLLSLPSRPIDREKIIQERMEDHSYQKELEVYRKSLDALLISF